MPNGGSGAPAMADIRPGGAAESGGMSTQSPASPPIRLLSAILVSLCALVGATAAGAQTFSGTYDWSSGGSGSLVATFAPAGETEGGAPAWDVTFDFTFYGKDHTWKGTAEGALEDGATITGNARGSRRDWVFTGTLEDGVLAGDHAQLKRGGKKSRSGSFSIKASADPLSPTSATLVVHEAAPLTPVASGR
ncbi:MAG: hypothetical protein AAGF23_00265 [Acidobacteriota bacterium]